MDYQLTLYDRLEVTKAFVAKYGEENMYLSYSGGKDSTCLSVMLDMACPNNKIPRVYINTGIEYTLMVDYVATKAKNDPRIIMIKPTKPIKKVLEQYGYPFKSKEHSNKVSMYQNGSNAKTLQKYIKGSTSFDCPERLKYQFTKDFNIKISAQCCYKLKKDVAHKYEKESGRHIAILGLRQDEGGQRANKSGCVVFKPNTKDPSKFKPLNPLSDDFLNEFVKRENIRLCDLYYPPYNFKRTGCKGCPYNLNLQEDLAKMENLLPSERKQCEIIWKPIYDEYRRIGYRLNKDEQLLLF